MKEYLQGNNYIMKLLLKWKLHFFIVSGLAIGISVVFSSEYFMPPVYKSFAIVYPSNIIPYSSETPTEQMLQLLESNDVRDEVIRKFDLAKHYNIDTAEESGHYKLITEYESNIEAKHTSVSSIEIKAYDTDPKLASEIVSEIINAVNVKARNLQRDKTKEVVVILENLMQSKKAQIDSVNNALQELRVKYQILDYDLQTREVSRGYYGALGNGARKENLKDIDVMMRNLEEKGGDFYKLQQTFNALLKSYNATKLEYDQAVSDLTKELTYTNLISRPFPADKKSFPIRWIVVVTSLLSANLFLVFIIISIDKMKHKTVKHKSSTAESA